MATLGAGRLVKDIRHFLPGISCAVSWPCYLCWSVIITITYIVKQYDILYGLHFPLRIGIYRYPDWTLELGRFIVFSLPSFIIIYAIIYLIIAKGTFVQRLKSGFRPSVNWGPQESSAKQAWKEYNNKLPLPCGCCHPDCCVDSGAMYDVSIPLRVELTDNPGQPSSSPNDTDPHLPMNIKPGPETTVEDELYPNLTTAP